MQPPEARPLVAATLLEVLGEGLQRAVVVRRLDEDFESTREARVRERVGRAQESGRAEARRGEVLGERR